MTRRNPDSTGSADMSDKIAEIRKRHEDVAWRYIDLPVIYEDRATLLAEVDRLRADNERLFNEDTKTRHALGGWVWVCPDGGDEPTHERVAAVVAEVEKLRARVRQLEQVREAALNACADWYLSLRVDDRDSMEYVEPNRGLMKSMGKLSEIATEAKP